MENSNVARTRLVDFRLQVYASFTFRADALFELLDALLLSPIIPPEAGGGQPEPGLPTARLRRVYDALDNGRIDAPVLPRKDPRRG